MVTIEHAHFICDHCNESRAGIILTSVFNENQIDSIQLCYEHAKFFGKEMIKDE